MFCEYERLNKRLIHIICHFDIESLFEPQICTAKGYTNKLSNLITAFSQRGRWFSADDKNTYSGSQ